jgi:spore photoproduct lyase
MFDQIFVERAVVGRAKTREILQRLRRSDVHLIDKVEDIFGRAHKPYLHKRTNLHLFIGEKKGQLVKTAPPAYGTSSGHHYYFIHQYNCIYECEYCYLQGYFSSPDIVLYVNHDDICREITRFATEVHAPGEAVWFHAGEFSDSLALTGITREWDIYWQTFAALPNARLELRTKSHNTRIIEQLGPLPNVVVSFSLSPADNARQLDRGTPPLEARLKAITRLDRLGFRIGIHLDPIVHHPAWRERYAELCMQLQNAVRSQSVEYISIGTVRFTKPVFRAMERNYPESLILAQPFEVGADGKRRYKSAVDQTILPVIRQQLITAGFPDRLIYECMDPNQTDCAGGALL